MIHNISTMNDDKQPQRSGPLCTMWTHRISPAYEIMLHQIWAFIYPLFFICLISHIIEATLLFFNFLMILKVIKLAKEKKSLNLGYCYFTLWVLDIFKSLNILYRQLEERMQFKNLYIYWLKLNIQLLFK